MSAKAKPARDAFAFSLRGARALKPCAFVPAVADDAINRELERRPAARPPVTLLIEDFLARHFAAGCREAA